jgi:hypothetical protein
MEAEDGRRATTWTEGVDGLNKAEGKQSKVKAEQSMRLVFGGGLTAPAWVIVIGSGGPDESSRACATFCLTRPRPRKSGAAAPHSGLFSATPTLLWGPTPVVPSESNKALRRKLKSINGQWQS